MLTVGKNGKTYKGKRKGKKSKAPNDETLFKLYETMTAKEIGEKYGVAMGTVRNWIHDAREREGTL